MRFKEAVVTSFSLSRFHIVLIAIAGSLVFGWLLTGTFHPGLALLVGVDWFLVNLMNRAVDTGEDEVNDILGAEAAGRHRKKIFGLFVVIGAASLALHLVWAPRLIGPRILLHLLGLAYNLPLVPVGGRRVRLKTVYGVKNTASCTGFLVTLFIYPLVFLPLRAGVDVWYVLLLVAYFAPFEYSFEVIYDLRDVRGDAAHGVKSYPVVKGERWAGALVVLLNLAALHALLWGAAFGRLGLQEVILGVGPVVQLAIFSHGLRHGFTARLCTWLTYLFFGMLAGYVVWVRTGMPLTLGFVPSPALVVEVGLFVPGILLWLHQRRAMGDRVFATRFIVLALSAWVGEQTAIRFYHYYSYAAGGWHVLVGDVPLAVILIWPMLLLSTWELVHRLGTRGLRAALLGAGITFLEAAFIEVVCVSAGLWSWEGDGIFGVPLIGVAGWSAFAFGALAALEAGRLWILPVAGPMAVHLAVPLLWFAGFDRLSSMAVPDAVTLAVEALGMLALSLAAWRVRDHANIAMAEVVPRIAAAELIFLLLPLGDVPQPVVWFALLFSVPYLALFRLRSRAGALNSNP